jgi:cysteine sulfinate desulfinase/cysteine desulfurase-like protein
MEAGVKSAVYLDYQSSKPVDPRFVEAKINERTGVVSVSYASNEE